MTRVNRWRASLSAKWRWKMRTLSVASKSSVKFKRFFSHHLKKYQNLCQCVKHQKFSFFQFFLGFLNPLSPEGGWIFTPPWKNVFLKSWYLRFIKWDFKNWVNQWMATNISYILMHKSKFFETFLNNLQTVSIEYRKRLKKVGILRVKHEEKLLHDFAHTVNFLHKIVV